jgi:ferredoxin-type protein NapH
MKVKLVRKLVQISAVLLTILISYFLLLKPAAVCWLCPIWFLQNLASGHSASLFLGTSWRPPSFSFIWVLALFIFSALLIGRVFCGWLCPIGLGLEITAKISPVKRNFKDFPWLKWAKYLPLLLILLVALLFKEALFCQICPAGGVFRGLVGYFFPLALVALGVTLFLVFLLGLKIWCRYLCPFGSLLGIFSTGQVFGIRAEIEKCEKCETCRSACPVEINPIKEVKKDELKSPDCLMCLECIQACPNQALNFPWSMER